MIILRRFSFYLGCECAEVTVKKKENRPGFPLSTSFLLPAALCCAFFLSYQFPRTLRFFQFNVLRWQKSREPKLRDNRSTFPPLSFSLSFSPSLSPCVCRTLSRGGGVEEERKRFIFILSSFSILPQGKNNLTSFILHLTVSPSLSPPPPLSLPLSLTHSKDYGSRERSTSVRTRK